MDILVANAVAGIVLYVFSRWRRDLFFAIAGIWMIVLPAIFACFANRMHIVQTVFAVVGVILVGADMSGKLPGRSKLLREKARNP